MTKTYLKRISAPKTWPVLRKKGTFIARPKPKGQPLDLTLPVGVILRDVLNLVQNSTQARKILKTQEIMVNDKRIYHTSDAVGFMDILTLGKEHYRMLINKNGILTVTPVKKGEEFTVQKIAGKTALKGGKIQVNCSSGFNVLVEKNAYNVGDSITFKTGKIMDHFPLAKGAAVLVTSGSHIGEQGIVDSVEGNVLTITAGKEQFQTTKKYAYVIGKDKPAITINS